MKADFFSKSMRFQEKNRFLLLKIKKGERFLNNFSFSCLRCEDCGRILRPAGRDG